jgi:uncharacterized Zn finger protein
MPWYDWEDEFYDSNYEDEEITPDALVLEGPLHARSKRGSIGSTWWGQQWVAAMQKLGGSRLDRGKSYARNGKVLNLTIQYGLAFGKVQGSWSQPYQASIWLRVLDDSQWEKAIDSLAEQAIYAAKLLAGEMPDDIEGVFQGLGFSLFPRSWKDIEFECSCPDYGDPCKHAAAIYYLVAEQLDTDPFTLFHLRGRTRDQVLESLRRRRGGQSVAEADASETGPLAPPLDADLANFWTGGSTQLIRSAPMIPSQPPLLMQLGSPPDSTDAELRTIYERVSREAIVWLGEEDITE